MKKCNKCQETKELTEFYKRQGLCIPCFKEYSAQYQRDNYDRQYAIKRKYHKKEKPAVYKITNTLTNECYVGCSIQPLKRRAEHFSKTIDTKNSIIAPIISQIGKQYFKYEVLEECKPEVLFQREQYWITKLKPKYNG
jgi:hypothetical protein